ncbi:MAG: MBL fold metallo-hydrolase [Oscillospiraceae bacterium]|nr:MBL fold metallo-hydrolase [Oscillospiraceae bacterium]
MIFDTVPVEPIGTNCCLIGDEAANVCAVVDPGGSPELVLDMVARSGLELKMVLLTHAHYDHVGAIPALLEQYPDLPVYAHEGELCPAGSPNPRYFLPHLGGNQRTYGEGDTVKLGGLVIRVLHTPGHSRGSVTLLAGDLMLSGDTLFAGSCGRVDLPGGDEGQMWASLARLGRLTEDWTVWPGHGEATSLDYEKQTNPYLRQALAR